MAKSVIEYYETATAKCTNCESVYTLGMTVEQIEVEICGNCHPFYTGQETLIDTAGRIEKFQARLAKSTDQAGKKKKTKARKSIQTLADLNLGVEEAVEAPKKEVTSKPKAEKVAKEEVVEGAEVAASTETE
jgi:large subunit ribosomal protein L31